MSSNNNKIVVTGGKGLIGGYLLDIEGPDWVSVVRPGEGLESNEVGIDLEKSWAFDEVDLPSRCDSVIFLSQSNAYRELPQKANQLIQGNVVSLANMLEYAKKAGASSFVFASTGSIYKNDGGIISEDSPVIDQGVGGSLYPWSKLTGEQLVKSYSDCFSISILRFFFVYGSGGNRSMLLPRIAQTISDQKPVSIQQPDGCVICPAFAGDAAEVCFKSTQVSGQNVVNVAGPESLSLRQIADTMAEFKGCSASYNPTDGKPPKFEVNISKMKQLLSRDPVMFSDKVSTLF